MTRTKFFVGFMLILAAALSGCAKDHLEDGSAPASPAAVAKLVNTSAGATGGVLHVYFDEEAVVKVEEAVTRSEVATRAGIIDVDAVLEEISVENLEPIFTIDPRFEERMRAFGLHRWYAVHFDDSHNLDHAAMALASLGEVERVEFSHPIQHIASGAKPMAVTRAESKNYPAFNDPYLDLQWDLINVGDTEICKDMKAGADVNCLEAWRLCRGDRRVIVAVLDNCVDWRHPDLAPNMWVNEAELNGQEGFDDDDNGYIDDIYGANFVGNQGKLEVSITNEAEGGESHGTHIAGTIAAVNNNGEGVCGIAGGSGNGDGVRIMACQIFWNIKRPVDRDSYMLNAFTYAANNGAAIVNCSYGYGEDGPNSDGSFNTVYSTERQAIEYFRKYGGGGIIEGGGVVIFAAGNEMMKTSGYPAAYKDYISVTSMSCDYTPAYYTNHGPGSNVAAPGGDWSQSYYENREHDSEILSTLNMDQKTGEFGYGYMMGTSMACPHVTGVAALGLSYALQQGITLSRDEMNSILVSSVNDIDPYCTGTRVGLNGTMQLSSYAGKMGAGYIDAFKVLMNVRGTTCVPVGVSESPITLDLLPYFGDGNANVTIQEASFSDSDMERLGITTPMVSNDKIYLTCKKAGSAIMTVTYMAGTTNNSGISGHVTTKEFAIIARENHTSNGGWL